MEDIKHEMNKINLKIANIETKLDMLDVKSILAFQATLTETVEVIKKELEALHRDDKDILMTVNKLSTKYAYIAGSAVAIITIANIIINVLL